MKTVLIIGATSAIAQAAARIWAGRGCHFFLVARDLERIKAIEVDLMVRGSTQVVSYCLDVNQIEGHSMMLEMVNQTFATIDVVLIAHGTLSNQKICEQSVEQTLLEINTNAVSTVALLTKLANLFERQKSGAIAVISSVAGDRGRQSNYVYGSCKAMLNAFTSGLRQRLSKQGVLVTTLKPGFVDSPMTREFKKGILWASPERVAQQLINAIDAKRDVVYLPAFWRMIMLIIKALPEGIFKRLTL